MDKFSGQIPSIKSENLTAITNQTVTLPPFVNSINELRSLSTALSTFLNRYDELNNHLSFIKLSIDAKLPRSFVDESFEPNQSPFTRLIESLCDRNVTVETEETVLERNDNGTVSENVSENVRLKEDGEIDSLKDCDEFNVSSRILETDTNILNDCEGMDVLKKVIETDSLKIDGEIEASKNYGETDTLKIDEEVDVSKNFGEIDVSSRILETDTDVLNDCEGIDLSNKDDETHNDVVKDSVVVDVSMELLQIDTLKIGVEIDDALKNNGEIDVSNKDDATDTDVLNDGEGIDVLKKVIIEADTDVLKDSEVVDVSVEILETDILEVDEEIDVLKNNGEIDVSNKDDETDTSKIGEETDVSKKILESDADVLNDFEGIDGSRKIVETDSDVVMDCEESDVSEKLLEAETDVLMDCEESDVSDKLLETDTLTIDEEIDVLKDSKAIDLLNNSEEVDVLKKREEADSLKINEETDVSKMDEEIETSMNHEEIDTLKNNEEIVTLKNKEEVDFLKQQEIIDTLKKQEEIVVSKKPESPNSPKKLEEADISKKQVNISKSLEEIDMKENDVSKKIEEKDDTKKLKKLDISKKHKKINVSKKRKENDNLKPEEIDVCKKHKATDNLKKLEKIDILKKHEKADVLKNHEKVGVSKKREETDVLKKHAKIVVSKKHKETESGESKKHEKIVVSKKHEESGVPKKHEKKTDVLKKHEKIVVSRKHDETDVLKKRENIVVSKKHEEINTSKKTAFSELESFCARMDGRGMKKYVSTHISDMTKLREELPKVLKLAKDPAKLVLESIGRFYVQSGKSYSNAKKHRKEVVLRLASIMILECFVMISSDGIKISREDKEHAEEAAVTWKQRMIKEGGVRHMDETDARGLLLLISGFGIPDRDFKIVDIMDLITASNVEGISTALRRSIKLIPKLPDVIDMMVKNNLEIKAADTAYTFGLEDKCHPQIILRKKIRDIQNSSPSQMLSDLKSIKRCLEFHKVEPSNVLPDFKINEKIQQLEKEIKNRNLTPKRKSTEPVFAENPIHHRAKRACYSHENMPHMQKPVDHYPMNPYNRPAEPSTGYYGTHVYGGAVANQIAHTANVQPYTDNYMVQLYLRQSQTYDPQLSLRQSQTYDPQLYGRSPIESYPVFPARRAPASDLYSFADRFP